MKKSLISIFMMLGLLLGFAVCAAEEEAEFPFGQPFEDFTVETIDGGSFTLSEALKDKDLVLINLWATWCGPCRMEFPYMQQAYEQYSDRIAIIALSVEPEDTVEA